jgi:hypothetical protein
MSEQNKPFVVTDRRKFTLDGTPRPDADPSPEREETPPPAPAQTAAPTHEAPLEFKSPTPEATVSAPPQESHPDLPPPPTPAEMEQANAAYRMTSERLDTAVRAANPGMDRPPEMSFEQIIQSIYMTTILQLGGATEPGQQPKIDLMGARSSIDMLSILADKTRNNLTPAESALLDNALFEVRMGFLEVTQALARASATRQPPPPGSGPAGPPPGRPSIVR